MKYYIYISDMKIEMLYPQIPQSLLKKIASNLSIDLKLFGAEVSVASKSSSSDETRYAKVRIVSEYIEKHLDVGSIDAPGTYFKGILSMTWGPIYDQAVYFSGVTSRQAVIGLGGSLKHVLGAIVGPRPDGFHLPVTINSTIMFPSSAGGIIMTLEEMLKNSDSKFGGNTKLPESSQIIELMTQIENNQRGPKQRFEFLAKTLLQNKATSESYVVLGTPIYVALAD